MFCPRKLDLSASAAILLLLLQPMWDFIVSYRTRIACKEDGQLPEEKYNYVRYILLLFWIMTNAFHPLICRTGLNFYKAKDGCEMSGRWKRGIFWARTPLFPSSLLLFNNRKRLMLQLDLFSTLLASLSLSLSPSLLLIYVLMILLSAIGCQWERNYNVWSFCSSFVLPLSIHSLDDAGMTDYKQDWKCWCVYIYYFISCSLWPEMAHQNQRKNRFWV